MNEDRKLNGTKSNRKNRFSFHQFIIKITSRKFWVWILSSYFIYEILTRNGNENYFIPLIIAWSLISILFMVGEPLEKALSMAVEKMELKLQMNNTIDTKIGSNK